MKKYVLLTSLLALTACGGGSGGGHHNSSVPFAPGGNAVRSAVTQDVINSNKQITSMASEILVPQGGSGDTLVRSGTVNYEGQIYKSYRLDDVNFKIGGEDSLLKFELNEDGKIVSVGKYDRSDNFTGNPAYAISQQGLFTRTAAGDGNQFAKRLSMYKLNLDSSEVDEIASEHFSDGIELITDVGLSTGAIRNKMISELRKEINKIKASQDENDEHYTENIAKLDAAYNEYLAQINGKSSFEPEGEMDATLIVKGVDIDLKYADLGFAELSTEEEHTFSPYVGGYNALKIRPADLATDTTFTGTAIAGIDHKKKGFGESEDVKEGMLVRQDDARLTMCKNGTATLVMDNLVSTDDNPVALRDQGWYDVKVVIAANGLPTFYISGDSDVERFRLPSLGGPIDPEDPFAKSFTSGEWQAHEQQYVHNEGSAGTGERFGGVAEANIYGANTGDMEATARFGFSNEVYSENNTKHEEVAIYGAFGGKPLP